MTFDTQRTVVATGEGIVARFPGVLCVARCPDAGPLRQLLALCAEASGADPGRELARRFATWLTGPDAPGDGLAFGTLAAAGDQLAVFLVGPVDAWVDGPEGTMLSGADAAIGTDRLLPRPSDPVVLSAGDATIPDDVADVHDLRIGVVAGAGAVLHPPPVRRYDPDRLTGTPSRFAGGPDRFTDVPDRHVETPAGFADAPDRSGDLPAGAADVPDLPTDGPALPTDAPAGAADASRRPADTARADRPDETDRPVGSPEPPPGHDWFAARPEPPPAPPPPAVGPWDTRAWPSSPNGSAPARANGRPSTAVVPATAGPWASGRHAILDPAPARPGDRNDDIDPDRSADTAEGPGTPGDHLLADTEGASGSVDDRPAADGEAEPGGHRPAGAEGGAEQGGHRLAGDADDAVATGTRRRPDETTVEPGRRPADGGETSAFGAHRPADAATVSKPLPNRGEPDAPAPAAESAPGARSRLPSPVPRPSPAPATGSPVEVSGFLCEQGHLSDPRAPFCGQCGSPIDDRAGGLVTGTRPALGRLLFDDGAVYAVDDGLLVGRLPESDDRVQAGGLRPVVVEDPTGSVSRVHAEIQISGWDVMLHDAGSRNGTFVAGPEDSAWSPLPPERGRRLLPGTRVRLGGRTFVFDSSSGLR